MFYSYYNSIIKVFYITATASIIIMIKYTEPFKNVYNPNQDSFPIWKFAVLPCATLAIGRYYLFQENSSFLELAWSFSLFLESIAILPQLMVLRNYRLVENLTGKFVFFLGTYRFLYVLNWIWRAKAEKFIRINWVLMVCGCVQTILYADFFYQYLRIACPCRKSRREENDDNDEGLIFEFGSTPADRKISTTDAKKGLLSENDHSLLLLDVSIPDDEEALRRRSADD
jgi:hypothetical protein